jgi:hypothetical protein
MPNNLLQRKRALMSLGHEAWNIDVISGVIAMWCYYLSYALSSTFDVPAPVRRIFDAMDTVLLAEVRRAYRFTSHQQS